MPFPSVEALTEVIGPQPTVSHDGDVIFHVVRGQIAATVQLLAHGTFALDLDVDGIRLVHIEGQVEQIRVFTAPRSAGLDIRLRGPNAPAPFFLRFQPTIEICWTG